MGQFPDASRTATGVQQLLEQQQVRFSDLQKASYNGYGMVVCVESPVCHACGNQGRVSEIENICMDCERSAEIYARNEERGPFSYYERFISSTHGFEHKMDVFRR